MKKVLVVLLIVLMTIPIFAGGRRQGDGVHVFRFVSGPAGAVARQTIEIFLDYIENNSGGQIRVEAFLEGSLFANAEDMLSATQSNIVQGAMEADMALSWAAPEWISWSSVPFAFENNDQVFRFFMGPIGREINSRLERDFNIRFLDTGFGARGPRMLTANRPIRTPADMQGLRFRVPNVIGTIASWEAMGANVIGVPWGELFTSLQTGLVDAQENPFAQIDSGAFFQVQRYIMETAHQIGPQFFFVNNDFWQSLSPELQTVFNNANRVAWDFWNQATAAEDAELRQKFIDAGNVIIPASEMNIAAFRSLIAERVVTNPQITGAWAPGGWDYIQSLR